MTLTIFQCENYAIISSYQCYSHQEQINKPFLYISSKKLFIRKSYTIDIIPIKKIFCYLNRIL
jgi:hypothetical protein